ncbi:MAG: tRNA pseudouridine(38-40) synthase TruA [Chloroflexi bacterium]|nr:MAG: tRNA pseudouridine(38-40) synthase TruA [Chloroflexota bacterium]PIE80128.1 MAG: tRNA pseudouridine(38-40) synthase TruA [Chloroflexota bacterium]
MARFRALVEYDGTDYFGFQRQIAEQPTVQSELERVLRQIVREPVTITGSGRTDSGVHATGQVISFDSEWRHTVADLQRALNANLPADIAILQLDQAEPSFHPRFDARKRAYEYYVYNAAVRSPLRRRRSWHVAKPLDWERMNQAANCLIGIHDFATFGQPPQGTVTVREVFAAQWEKRNELLVFTMVANAFLYRMVRSIVGSLKMVGEGGWTVEMFEAALAACDRSRSGAAAPAQGLTLVSVTYGE